MNMRTFSQILMIVKYANCSVNPDTPLSTLRYPPKNNGAAITEQRVLDKMATTRSWVIKH